MPHECVSCGEVFDDLVRDDAGDVVGLIGILMALHRRNATGEGDYVDAASQMVRARYTLVFRKKQIDYHVGRLSPSVSMFNPENSR